MSNGLVSIYVRAPVYIHPYAEPSVFVPVVGQNPRGQNPRGQNPGGQNPRGQNPSSIQEKKKKEKNPRNFKN